MYNQLLISLQIEEKWYTFRLFFGILSCYYLHEWLKYIKITFNPRFLQKTCKNQVVRI